MTTRQRLQRNGLPNQIYEELLFDGGWLNKEAIRLLVPNASLNTIEKALGRLAEKGYLEQRLIETGKAGRWRIAEYRAVPR